MTHQATNLLNVWLDAWSEHRKVGRLALQNRNILFEYDPAFLISGLEISPLNLPLRSEVFAGDIGLFGGLPGVFHDSVPDGWGRLLLDRALQRHGINPSDLNVLDRLSYVGHGGMGALSYQPERTHDGVISDEPLLLDKLAEESAIVLAGEDQEVFDDLLQLNGSSGGARPKVLVQVSGDRTRIIHGQRELQDDYSHWLIKFGSSQDARDAGAVEFAYSLMARDAGLEIPETHLFRTRKGGRFFGVRRFDRNGDERIHMHSLGGLIHADHRIPSLDYDALLSVTRELTANTRDVEKAYALAAFNVLSHNRDDHAKNFSFLLTRRHEWVLAPAYDLTFSAGPGGEQSMLVMGEGRNPGVTHLQALGRQHGLKDAPAILERVQAAVSRWRQHAEDAGVRARTVTEIGSRIAPGRAQPRRKQASRKR
jgi:serine/threonine-protein kinase HipA